MPSFLLGIFPEVELPGDTVTLCLNLCQFPFDKLVIFYYLESYGDITQSSAHPFLILAHLQACVFGFPMDLRVFKILAANLLLSRFSPVLLCYLHQKLRGTPSMPAALIIEWLSRQALTWCHVGLAVIPVCQGLGK